MFEDARNVQIVFLTTFLTLGVAARDWTVRGELLAAVALSCLLAQLICRYGWPRLQLLLQRGSVDGGERQLGKGPSDRPSDRPSDWPSVAVVLSSLRSAAITTLSLCLLLRANSPLTMMLAGVLAIASKFIFTARGKHFFNPANFGIIAALLLTSDAWVSPGQWGTEWWAVLVFAGAGGMVLGRVGRWDTSAAFLGVYAALEMGRNAWLGWSWDVTAHHLTSGSLLLFALFMLTDPRSIPNARTGRLVWATAIAGLTFILRYGFYVSAAPFWALFALAPLTIWVDRCWPADRFDWQSDRADELAGQPPVLAGQLSPALLVLPERTL